MRALQNTLLVLALLLEFCIPVSRGFQSCPSVCTCKWKNGKRWVECQKKQQILIPDSIDPETQVLDFAGNNLQILPREVFSRHGLLNLQKLKLSNCNIGQIDPTAFRGLTNLVELDLSSNILTSVPTPTFSDIPYLRELALNNNPLQKIEGHAFEMVPQIVALDVSGCQIKKIASRAFHNIEQLERLYLHNNKIEEIKQKTVESVAKLHSLTLHGNPWKCDCELRPLIDWLMVANLPMVDLPKCKTPRRLSGKRFTDIAIDNFACPPELMAATRYIESNIGSNATIYCKVGSIPTSSIKWIRDGHEIMNNSIIDKGIRKFVIYETGSYEMNSKLVVTHSADSDSGQYMCVAENKAGRTEANFTLKVGYFSGAGSLNTGEIIGITITLILVILIIIVIVAVLILKVKPTLLRSEKTPKRPTDTIAAQNNNPSPMEMSYTTVQNGQNGSVVINGTTYSHTNGLANGYINPDVIPTVHSPTSPSVSQINSDKGKVSGLIGSLKRIKNKDKTLSRPDDCDDSEEIEQNRANGTQLNRQSVVASANSALPQNNGEGPPGMEAHQIDTRQHRYQNIPLPVNSVGVSSSSCEPESIQRESFYSPNVYINERAGSLIQRSSSPRFDIGPERFPPLKDHFDTRLGAINDSFSDDTGMGVGNGLPSGSVFHRNNEYKNDMFVNGDVRDHNPGFRTLRPLASMESPYGHTTSYSMQPQFASSSPFFHGTLPKNFAMNHSTTNRPDWVASPIRLPDWIPSNPHTLWSIPNSSGQLGEQDYPSDYGLPIPRGGVRPEIHLAHNPLDTLEEEDIFPNQQYSHPSIHALEMLNQSVGNANYGSKILLDNSSSQESSGRGSSSSGSAKHWNAPTTNSSSIIGNPVKKPFQTNSARESPDEGIQTDSGTDV